MTSLEINEILNCVRGQYTHLVLFGSFSRGDNETNSDLDILQITNKPFPSYNSRHINFSVYSLDNLQKMSREGSLFVLHLIKESKILVGDNNVFSLLKKDFPYKKDYKRYQKDILLTAQLLDISVKVYKENWKGFNSLICYLFRSYLYSLLTKEDDFSFSINYLRSKFNDDRISKTLELRKFKQPDFLTYSFCKIVFEEYAQVNFINEFKNTIDLVNHLKTEFNLPEDLAKFFLTNVSNSANDY